MKVYLPSDTEEDDSILFSKRSLTTLPTIQRLTKAKKRPIRLYFHEEPGELDKDIPSTLKLDINSVQVIDVQSVRYATDARHVSRHRETEEERNELEQGLGITDYIPEEMFVDES